MFHVSPCELICALLPTSYASPAQPCQPCALDTTGGEIFCNDVTLNHDLCAIPFSIHGKLPVIKEPQVALFATSMALCTANAPIVALRFAARWRSWGRFG